jgi:UDP-galactopyranose mutase
MPSSRLQGRRYLVVGAGFTGSVIARELTEEGADVDVIDRRPHVAGNAYDEVDENGIRVHRYGPHLFHTNNERVYRYLSRFTDWVPYEHRVVALWHGKLVPFPPNEKTSRWTGFDREGLVDVFYRPYTRKMWGVEMEELDPGIVNRVKFQDPSYETRYFPRDEFQFLPKDGYTRLIENVLDHDGIHVSLNVEFTRAMEAGYDHVFACVPIDEYYDYEFGELPYRSIRFHTTTVPAPHLYGKPVVNFTHDGRFTRVTEWKCLPGHGKNRYVTTVTAEEPCDYRHNDMERYYPVKDVNGLNRARYERYKSIPNERVTFTGRCGLYAYIDMHQSVNIGLTTAQKHVEGIVGAD